MMRIGWDGTAAGVALLRLAQGGASPPGRRSARPSPRRRPTGSPGPAVRGPRGDRAGVGDAADRRKAVDEFANAKRPATFRDGLVAAADHARGAGLLAEGHAGEALGALRAA